MYVQTGDPWPELTEPTVHSPPPPEDPDHRARLWLALFLLCTALLVPILVFGLVHGDRAILNQVLAQVQMVLGGLVGHLLGRRPPATLKRRRHDEDSPEEEGDARSDAGVL